MQVDNLVEAPVSNDQEERPVVQLDAVFDENLDPLVNLLLHFCSV